MIAFEVTHFVRVDTHKIRSRSVSFLEILGLVLNIFNFVGNQFQDLGHEVCSLRVGLTCNFDEIVEDLDDVLADGHEEDREPLVLAVLLLGLEVLSMLYCSLMVSGWIRCTSLLSARPPAWRSSCGRPPSAWVPSQGFHELHDVLHGLHTP